MDWAQGLANKMAESDAAIQTRHAWQLHEAKVIENEGPEAFAHLSEKIKECIGGFNRASGITRFKIKATVDSVTVESVSTPTSSLSLTLDGRFIQLRSFVPGIIENPIQWKRPLRLEGNNTVSIDGSVDFQKLAESLLEKFIGDLMTARR